MRVNDNFKFSRMITKLGVISAWLYMCIDIIFDKKFILLKMIEIVYMTFGMFAISFIYNYSLNESAKKGK